MPDTSNASEMPDSKKLQDPIECRVELPRPSSISGTNTMIPAAAPVILTPDSDAQSHHSTLASAMLPHDSTTESTGLFVFRGTGGSSSAGMNSSHRASAGDIQDGTATSPPQPSRSPYESSFDEPFKFHLQPSSMPSVLNEQGTTRRLRRISPCSSRTRFPASSKQAAQVRTPETEGQIYRPWQSSRSSSKEPTVRIDVTELPATDISTRMRSMRLSDVSFVTEAEEEMERIPYNIKDEAVPDRPFYSSTFQLALRNGLAIANEVAVATESCSHINDDKDVVKSLISDAKFLGSFRSTDTRIIAVLGDSGEGKSSVINSLLNVSELARTTDSGSACTSVVTEYRQKRSDQTSPIHIEVEYLSLAQIGDLLKELVWDYRKYHLAHVSSDQSSEENRERWKNESDKAWSMLEPAFKHKDRFNKDFLRDDSDGAEERITEQLVSWSADLAWPAGGNDGFWASTADSTDECREKTDLFFQDQIWPFTKIIRVYLESDVLKSGIVFADLPGFHDTNLARMRTSQAYLMGCNLYLIVANISRVISNRSVASSLVNVLSRHLPTEWEEFGSRNLHFAFVCTMTEISNTNTQKKEYCGFGKPISITAMNQLEEEISQAKRQQNRELKKKLKQRRDTLLMHARNSHVRERLQATYGPQISGGHLNVFCVSNAWYQKYTRKGNIDMVQASGIPDLRRFCYTVTAQAQLNEAQNFLLAKIPALLNSVELWADSAVASENRNQALPLELFTEKIKVMEEQLYQTVTNTRLVFLTNFSENIAPYFSRRDQVWTQDASARHSEWTGWHWMQYNAWCKNDGNHSTARRDSLNWNSEIIWKLRTELALPWEQIEDELPGNFTSLLLEAEKILSGFRTFTRSHRLSDLVANCIDLQMCDLRYQVGVVQQNLTTELRRIRRYTFEPCGNSYILTEMLPAYRAASRESGSGMKARQVRHVGNKIERSPIFSNIGFRVQSAFESLLDTSTADITTSMRKVAEVIEKDVRTTLLFSEADDNTLSDSELCAVRNLADTVTMLKARHVTILDSIKDLPHNT